MPELSELVCVLRGNFYLVLKSLVPEKQSSQLVYSASPLCHLGFCVCVCVLFLRESCVYSGVTLKFNFA